MIGLLAMAAALGFESGNSLLEECKGSAAPVVTCMGYVAGVTDTLSASDSMSTTVHAFCRPQEATVGQMKDVVVQYLEAHPEFRHLSAAGLSAAALIEAFPCAK